MLGRRTPAELSIFQVTCKNKAANLPSSDAAVGWNNGRSGWQAQRGQGLAFTRACGRLLLLVPPLLGPGGGRSYQS